MRILFSILIADYVDYCRSSYPKLLSFTEVVYIFVIMIIISMGIQYVVTLVDHLLLSHFIPYAHEGCNEEKKMVKEEIESIAID